MLESLIAPNGVPPSREIVDEQVVEGATSGNTPSTLVKRDASGNFAAGTITAALAGNATTSTDGTAAKAATDAATSAATASVIAKRDANADLFARRHVGIVELVTGKAQVQYVTADPRSAGLNLPVGSLVVYAASDATPIVLVKEIAANDYGWRRINEKYALPGSGAEALGLLGFTPTSMYKPGDYVNSCPDLIGANHLTAKVTANANMGAVIDGHRVWWGNSTTAKQTADVLSPALSDFWAATVFTMPGPVNTSGIIGRYSATPKGWCCYFLSGALHAIINDGTHGSGVLSLTAPALRPDTDSGTLYLLQFSFNRGTGKVNVRLGKRGATADKLQDSDQSAINLSLAESGKEFGFGVTDGGSVLTGGGAYAWAAQLTGTAKDQTAMAAIETAMGFAA